jgi:MFS family permease
VDAAGALLLAAGLVALMLPLTEGERWGWTSAGVLGLVAVAAALLAAWGLVERRSPSPMVDLRMLADRPVLITNITTLGAGFALFGCFVLVPAFVEAPSSRGYGFDASATQAGLYLLPSSLAILISGPAAGVLGRRFGSKWILVAGMLLVATSAALLAWAHDEPWHVVVATGVLGVGAGIAFATTAALIAENDLPTETGVATGVNTVVRMIGLLVGGQVGAALLTAKTIGNTTFPAESAFTTAFALSAGAGVVAALVAVSIGPARSRRRLAPLEALD